VSSDACTTTSVARTRISSPAFASTASVSELPPILRTERQKRSISPTLLGARKSHSTCAIGIPWRPSVWKRAKSTPSPSLNQSSTSSLNSTKYCG